MKTQIKRKEAEEFLKKILPGLKKTADITIAGSIRRKKDLIGDIDLVCVPKNRDLFLETILDIADEILAWGEIKIRTIAKGKQIDFQIATKENKESMLLYLTGNMHFNIMCRGKAKKLGLRLNEYGLFNEKGIVTAQTEEEILEKIGLKNFINPIQREIKGWSK
jgi:DNA polymerase (family 10)